MLYGHFCLQAGQFSDFGLEMSLNKSQNGKPQIAMSLVQLWRFTKGLLCQYALLGSLFITLEGGTGKMVKFICQHGQIQTFWLETDSAQGQINVSSSSIGHFVKVHITLYTGIFKLGALSLLDFLSYRTLLREHPLLKYHLSPVQRKPADTWSLYCLIISV